MKHLGNLEVKGQFKASNIIDTMEFYCDGCLNYVELKGNTGQYIGVITFYLQPGEKLIIKDYRNTQTDNCNIKISNNIILEEGEYRNVNILIHHNTSNNKVSVERVYIELFNPHADDEINASFTEGSFIWIRFAIVKDS